MVILLRKEMLTDSSLKPLGLIQVYTNIFKGKNGIYYQSLVLIIIVFLANCHFPLAYNDWNISTKNVFKQCLGPVEVIISYLKFCTEWSITIKDFVVFRCPSKASCAHSWSFWEAEGLQVCAAGLGHVILRLRMCDTKLV